MNIDALRDRLLDYPNNVLEGSPLLREAAKAIEYLDATGIHSCSPYCKNWACVMRRENETLKAALKAAREAEREACARTIEDYAQFGDTRDCAAAIRARKP
jgi:hypothetical protein